jgi:hypothetical protein
MKLALLERAEADRWELFREQRAEFGPFAAALAERVPAATGIEHTLALWRHKAMSATMQFLDDLIPQAESSSTAALSGHSRSRRLPAAGPP